MTREREETDRLLFGQTGLMYRGRENRTSAMRAVGLIILHTDGTYEVVKNYHAGLTLGSRVEEPTVLYLDRDNIRVVRCPGGVPDGAGRVRLVSPQVSQGVEPPSGCGCYADDWPCDVHDVDADGHVS